MSCPYCTQKQEVKKINDPSEKDMAAIVQDGTYYYKNEDGEAVVLCNTCGSLWSIRESSLPHDPREGGWGETEWELLAVKLNKKIKDSMVKEDIGKLVKLIKPYSEDFPSGFFEDYLASVGMRYAAQLKAILQNDTEDLDENVLSAISRWYKENFSAEINERQEKKLSLYFKILFETEGDYGIKGIDFFDEDTLVYYLQSRKQEDKNTIIAYSIKKQQTLWRWEDKEANICPFTFIDPFFVKQGLLFVFRTTEPCEPEYRKAFYKPEYLLIMDKTGQVLYQRRIYWQVIKYNKSWYETGKSYDERNIHNFHLSFTEDEVFLADGYTLVCFSLKQKKILWETQLKRETFTGEVTPFQDKLFARLFEGCLFLHKDGTPVFEQSFVLDTFPVITLPDFFTILQDGTYGTVGTEERGKMEAITAPIVDNGRVLMIPGIDKITFMDRNRKIVAQHPLKIREVFWNLQHDYAYRSTLVKDHFVTLSETQLILFDPEGKLIARADYQGFPCRLGAVDNRILFISRSYDNLDEDTAVYFINLYDLNLKKVTAYELDNMACFSFLDSNSGVFCTETECGFGSLKNKIRVLLTKK